MNETWTYEVVPARTVKRRKKAPRPLNGWLIWKEKKPEEILIRSERGVFTLVGATLVVAREIVNDHNNARAMRETSKA